jgi:carboxylesterase type B
LSQYVPVWAYEFKDTNAPELFNLPTVFPYGAAHASELQFIFDPNAFFPNVDYQVPTDPFPLSPDERRLSQEMVRYCAGFWTPATTKLSARSGGRRPKSAKARSRGKVGAGWAASAMGFDVGAEFDTGAR